MIHRLIRCCSSLPLWLFVALAMIASCSSEPEEEDAAPLDTKIDAAPAAFSNVAKPRFLLSSNYSGVTFRCQLDGERPIPCGPVFEPQLADGAHSLVVTAVSSRDAHDLTPARHSWTIDTVAPVTVITRAPATIDNSTATRFELQLESRVTAYCSLDRADPSPCVSTFLTGTLTEGRHTFTVLSIDAANNVEKDPLIHEWWIDTTIPDTTLESAPSGELSSTSASFTFSSRDAGLHHTFRCIIDGVSREPCESPYEITSLGQGPHTFRVQVIEPNAFPDPTPAEASWIVDTIAPTLSISSGPSGPTSDTTPTFSFTGAPSQPWVTSECRVVSGLVTPEFVACTSPFNAAEVSEGPATFEVRARDLAGNQSEASRPFAIDLTPPAVELTLVPPPLTNSSSAVFRFAAAAATSTRCQLDGGTSVSCTSPHIVSSMFAGEHTFRVIAFDAAGNQASASYTFTVDVSAPGLSVSGPPSPTANPQPVVTFSASGDAATIECRLGSAAYAPCTSPVTLGPLALGGYSFTVRATDAAGNAITRSVSFSVDPRPLSITITGGPLGETRERTPIFTWTSTGATSGLSCRYDVDNFGPCYSPLEQVLPDGPHTFEIRAANDLGGVAYATQSFTVDTVAPSATITAGPSGVITAPDVVFEFVTSGAPVVTECRLFREGAANGPYAPCSSPHPATLAPPTTPYPYVFEVRVRDQAGNQWSAYRSFTFAPG